jgi:hypothetical protein
MVIRAKVIKAQPHPNPSPKEEGFKLLFLFPPKAKKGWLSRATTG